MREDVAGHAAGWGGVETVAGEEVVGGRMGDDFGVCEERAGVGVLRCEG